MTERRWVATSLQAAKEAQNSLLLQDFFYELPRELIAQEPLPERDGSRLMVLERGRDRILHSNFVNLPDFLNDGDVLVLNDVRVMPWRLYGTAENGRSVECLLLREIDQLRWESLLKPGKRLLPGISIEWNGGLKSFLQKRLKKGRWLIKFEYVDNLRDRIEKSGYPPIPPYIKRDKNDRMYEIDRKRYQTIFAERDGAVAAPTASLHFSGRVLDALKEKGVKVCFLTLKVGRGSFEPVRTEVVSEHKMEGEYFAVSQETADIIMGAKKNGNRIIAAGTTVVRSLESAVNRDGGLKSASGYTDLFIYPGFHFRVIDAMLTNFHLPCSTPLILTCAFAGRERILSAYEEAKKLRYRFLSYGDAMLIVNAV